MTVYPPSSCSGSRITAKLRACCIGVTLPFLRQPCLAEHPGTVHLSIAAKAIEHDQAPRKSLPTDLRDAVDGVHDFAIRRAPRIAVLMDEQGAVMLGALLLLRYPHILAHGFRIQEQQEGAEEVAKRGTKLHDSAPPTEEEDLVSLGLHSTCSWVRARTHESGPVER